MLRKLFWIQVKGTFLLFTVVLWDEGEEREEKSYYEEELSVLFFQLLLI